MFRISAIHSETASFGAGILELREFFVDVSNYVNFMPNIDSIRTDNQGITHWQVSTHIPLVGKFREKFPIMKSEDSDERVEWSPFESEESNLMRFAADFLPETTSMTLVRITHNIELRRRSAGELHFLAGFAGESLISTEMTKSVAEMMKTFLARAKNRLESS